MLSPKFGTSRLMSLPLHLENRKFINPYIQKMADQGEYVLQEEPAKNSKSLWSSAVFKNDRPLHVEIGTGNGFHFAHYAQQNPNVSLVGFEIKFKTLVQSIGRARVHDCTNARMVLGPVKLMSDYFANGEVEKILIHFPDPWPKIRQRKNRLMSVEFLQSAYAALSPGGILEFKTDHHEYFLSTAALLRQTPFVLKAYTENLHHSAWAEVNFKTQFESLFLRKKQRINYFCLHKPKL